MKISINPIQTVNIGKYGSDDPDLSEIIKSCPTISTDVYLLTLND
jgi:hypothetical protein